MSPSSALDVSIRAQILDLFTDLRDRLDLAYLFISHDLSVVRSVTDEVMVMYRGKIIERGRTETIFNSPPRALHPSPHQRRPRPAQNHCTATGRDRRAHLRTRHVSFADL